jgi:uncharacterized protein YhbP (UPF0306 family)
MAIERSNRPMAATRITKAARRLLDASTLCSIATVTPGSRAHVSTAYFAWSPEFDLVWLSEPRARHSQNLAVNPSAAIAVCDSRQSWGKSDSGLQLFGRARDVEGAAAEEAETLYAERFTRYRRGELPAYRFYVFRPQRLKLFDERELGAGVFVTARVSRDRRLAWERTEIYRPSA